MDAKVHWLLKRAKGDTVIWVVVLLLSIYGLLAVYSSTGTLAYAKKGGNTEFYLVKQFVFIGIGLFLMWLCHLMDYRYYSRISQLLLYISFPLLAYTLLFGVEINDAARWISIPGTGFTFQTSDLAKLALIMYVARFLSKKQDDIKDFKKAFLPILFSISGVCVLIAPANLSTAMVLFSTCLLLMFIGRIPIKYILMVVLAGVIGLVIAGSIVMSLPDPALEKVARLKTWKSRIETFVFAKEKGGDTFQNDQAKIAIANGGLLGKGPGNSTQRNFLPLAHADFIFAIIIEEYGLLFGGVGLIVLYLILLFRSVRIVIRSPRAFGALLAAGLSFSLVIQAFINMGVAVNIFPVTGLALPLVSMGGTSTIFTSLAFGIILSVSRNIENEEEKEKEEGGQLATT